MPPQEISPTSGETKEVPFVSSYGFKYPVHRHDPRLCSDLWLEDKQLTDGAEGLWRIHNQLYDLNLWIDRHPGGSEWIKVTKGTDITEAFESFHISLDAEKILPKFYIREAKVPRNSPYTFAENGFYKTLKKRVQESMKTIPESTISSSIIITDLLLVGYVSTAILTAYFNSFLIGFISGVMLNMLAIAAHNFFHQRDNFRMYYFDLITLSSRDWRISHAMSHHLYTNTINDLEISLLEPFLWYLPSKDVFWGKMISCIISPFVWTLMIPGNAIRKYILIVIRTIKEVNFIAELIPYTIPLMMYLFGGQSFLWTLLLWLWIICVTSFFFGMIGLNAAHHHPEVFHDGDTPRQDRDWGLSQLDACMDRPEINRSTFLVLVSFGEHVLHHLFPTVDHSKLPHFYEAFHQTCEEFFVKNRVISQWDVVRGQFAQLLRTKTNPNPPGTKWKWFLGFVNDLKDEFWENVAGVIPIKKKVKAINN